MDSEGRGIRGVRGGRCGVSDREGKSEREGWFRPGRMNHERRRV